jgi:hypothetical protein
MANLDMFDDQNARRHGRIGRVLGFLADLGFFSTGHGQDKPPRPQGGFYGAAQSWACSLVNVSATPGSVR